TSTQQFARDVSSSFAGGYAENTARQWMGLGGKRSFENVAIDAFGNALGNSVAGKYQAAAEQARIKQKTMSFALSPEDSPVNWNLYEKDLTFATHVAGWDAQLESHFVQLAEYQAIADAEFAARLSDPTMDALPSIRLDPASLLADDIETFITTGKEFIQKPSIQGAITLAAIAIPGKVIDEPVERLTRKVFGKKGLEVPDKIDNVSTAELEIVLGQRYTGVKEASQFLQDADVPRDIRKQVLESFDIKTLNMRQATDSEFGIRYFDNVNAWEKGRYLFETFPASRQNLALKPKWNQMTYMKQFQIRSNTTILEGRVSSMGVGVEGSQIQKYILDLNDLLEP
ncbi:hypothetical protein EXA15_17010, partial [Vibrio cincinnatiensis]|nr:hypothetical protein [Vibrio cincinnatiensis]